MHHDVVVTHPDQPPSDQAPTQEQAGSPPPAGAGRPRAARMRRRILLQATALAVVLGLIIAAFTVPVDKVIEAPGPTWNVLATGSSDSAGAGGAPQEDLLTVRGVETYPTEGELRMTTISLNGCPGYPVTTADVLVALLSRDSAVLEREAVCPKEVTEEEIRATNQAAMTSSQDSAVVAALNEVGMADHLSLQVGGIAPEQTSSDLQQGDALKALTPQGGQRTEITSYTQLRDLMATIPAGTAVSLEIEREGQEATASLTTIESPGGTGSLLGVMIHFEVSPEVDVSFALSDVGGPSAGLMFALGIVDEITPGALTGGQRIAGTGTIALDGTVGPIGGIRQKMAGASQAGSDYFLAPADNCGEVVGHEPEGMEVYAVSTLHEGVETVRAIAAGKTSGLATCQNPNPVENR
ncbi:peptidase S16 [Actinomyces bowdenii]|uniref:endopeptidase La n=1 Tax=Actinomyces bowdenii TaxID=131109 RepID=A0A3P1UYM1_9ACTO|nr:S16 family serine protease [Actinomyces bowdenii]MBO3724878.1 peptidase S16 [Actinomyces bowdenii]RRD26105.1 peptidase S16 [Actinomyces bowdenii]